MYKVNLHLRIYQTVLFKAAYSTYLFSYTLFYQFVCSLGMLHVNVSIKEACDVKLVELCLCLCSIRNVQTETEERVSVSE